MKHLSIYVLGLSLLGVAACDSTSPDLTAPSGLGRNLNIESRASLPTIAGAAVADPQFSTLVAALQKAALVDTFSGNRHFTVFAPTNAAFDAAAAALLGAGNTGLDLVMALDVDTLTAVLMYHVTNGDRTAKSVTSAGSVRMLDGNAATITVTGGVAKIDAATIVATDVRASNGLIHVIDAVILPPAAN